MEGCPKGRVIEFAVVAVHVAFHDPVRLPVKSVVLKHHLSSVSAGWCPRLCKPPAVAHLFPPIIPG